MARLPLLRKAGGHASRFCASGPNLASITLGSWIQSISRDTSLRPYRFTSLGNQFTYTFNGGGRQVHTLEGPGSVTTHGYNAAGWVNEIAVRDSSQNLLDYHHYDFDGNGWVRAASRLTGLSTLDTQLSTNNFGYDFIGQFTSAQAVEPGGALRKNENLAYQYDASGNLWLRTENDFIQTFTSDALNQLSTITRAGPLTVSGCVTGGVVALGVNGKQAEIYGDSTFATAEGLTLNDGNNMLITAGTNAAGELAVSTVSTFHLPSAISFSYDLNGNMLSDGQRTFVYDDANQCTSVEVPGRFKIEFAYDGLGRRRIVRESGWLSAIGSWQLTNEVRHVYDGLLPIEERDGRNNPLVRYTRGLDLSGTFDGAGGIGGLLARTEGGSSAFYHSDLGGNITSLTDPSSHLAARYLYDPFGRILGQWGGLAAANRMRFSSMPTYEQAGLVGYWARLYDPNLQRWLNEDPIGEHGGPNLYDFVGSNPIRGVDPLGLEGNPVSSTLPGLSGAWSSNPYGAGGWFYAPGDLYSTELDYIPPPYPYPTYPYPEGEPEMKWDPYSGEWVMGGFIQTDDEPWALVVGLKAKVPSKLKPCPPKPGVPHKPSFKPGQILPRNAPVTAEERAMVQEILNAPKGNLSRADELRNLLVQRLMDRGYSPEEIMKWMSENYWKNKLP